MAELFYPPPGFHFRVNFELDKVTDLDTRFQEVSGLNAEFGIESLAEGGENRFAHKLPGKAQYPNLVLKRGLVTDSRLVSWFQKAIQSLEIKPATVTVSLLNEKHDPLDAWNVVGAWPVKWSLSNFNAQNNALVIETVELAYRYFTRTGGGGT